MSEYLQACVRRGAAYLDKNHEGWCNKIDLDDLDLLDGTKCILGQLNKNNGYYLGSPIYKEFGYLQSYEYGFCLNSSLYGDKDNHYVEDGDILTKLWKKEILLRRDKKNKVLSPLTLALRLDIIVTVNGNQVDISRETANRIVESYYAKASLS